MSASLLNKKAVRQFILAKIEALRPGWPAERVAADAFEKIDAHVRAYIVNQVQHHPTVGKTFKIE